VNVIQEEGVGKHKKKALKTAKKILGGKGTQDKREGKDNGKCEIMKRERRKKI